MKKLIIYLIIYIGLRRKQRFIRQLSKLEYGVSIFCKKLAANSPTPDLAQMLNNHAIQEAHHGRMLDSLANGTQHEASENERYFRKRFSIRETDKGKFISIKRSNGEELLNCVDTDINTKGIRLQWDSCKLGEQLVGIFENFDGISQRYLSAKLLFDGKSADSFDWADKLAFMHVLEQETEQFYLALAKIESGTPLGAIASQIVKDEQHHADYLKSTLTQFSTSPQQEIAKWQCKVRSCAPAVLVDLWFFALVRS
ncbi:ferritin-like domain-containing protein [Aetokthonos hydrillicola Thurmond2011]|jgi:rubrerythrin|uniref:Ferritin-like domain-containing protein n=1 Tax=Aetokthonos hydrillicola Thurmond2011 TaxID=2712845 RepID=A0AAP5IG48_9CYAN|nr:ferritin-like domain-containing protein [Aetokthonos hydrillicola]MBO3459943.1 ferritin-like domain-containing protein [Aetokthonos hydrillicola CCALA 1050]MBW4584062.1 ferritin-like domain-containing protein [Aetokthonos hydrillicola CCALA 1050]MDR9900704.1 ferritin-like domain-containing protein [Aetokthonos hydrillicola Thurmond2011]